VKTIVFDIEAGSADELFSYQSYDAQGYIRLCGWTELGSGKVVISTDVSRLLAELYDADVITGHNIVDYDLIALAVHAGADYERLVAKSWDTLIVERHVDPVAARGAQPTGYYKLANVAPRYGAPSKSDELDKLKRKYKGYDRIPLDHPDYQLYLTHDVEASEGTYLGQRARVNADFTAADKAYLRREHQVAAAMGRTSIEGARVNMDYTLRRFQEGQARIEAGKALLTERYGMPSEGKKPHTTMAGKAAFHRALVDVGVKESTLETHWPHSKDGSLAMGKDVLDEMIGNLTGKNDEAVRIIQTIKALNGERTVYGSVIKWTHDGKVHPRITPEQNSGRWSLKDPGLTVLGKRSGKAVERGMIMSDSPDEVLVAIDADQVDARAVAAMCQDPDYMALFGPGVDLHSEVAWRVFQRPECRSEMDRNDGRCDCEYRDRAKVFGHGWNYGMSPNTMVRNHNVPLAVAMQFDQGMKTGFPILAQWKEDVRARAGVVPYGQIVPVDDPYRVLVNPYGRRVRVERARAYTQATAGLGQSTTRDIMAEAILKLPPEIRRRVRVIVHDEIVLSIPRKNAQEVAQKIADSMAFDFHGVRITFGCSRVGEHWASCYGEQYDDLSLTS
jgi:DNA polymerase-1